MGYITENEALEFAFPKLYTLVNASELLFYGASTANVISAKMR